MMGDVEELLSEVARVSAARDKQPTLIVKSTAIATISLIEERLVDALAGETIRGMKAIAPGSNYFGANVRAVGVFGPSTYLPKDGREALVLGKAGRLVMARVERDGILRAMQPASVTVVTWRQVDAEDLRLEDLALYVNVLQLVLQRHLARAPLAEERDARVINLADRLRRALAPRPSYTRNPPSRSRAAAPPTAPRRAHRRPSRSVRLASPFPRP